MPQRLDKVRVADRVCDHCKRIGFHCPNCGLANCYALLKKDRIVMFTQNDNVCSTTEVPVTIVSYRCRSCGSTFDLLTPCDAPEPRPSQKSVRQQRLELSAQEAVINAALNSGTSAKGTFDAERIKQLGLDKYLKKDKPQENK